MASQLRHEASINTWVFELYVSKAIEAFRNKEYDSFVQFRDLIEALVVRPINDQSDMTIKLRFMQFLSRINDGDNCDVTFQSSLTPLESALTTLEHICSEIDVPQSVLEHVHTSVREMLIVVCIKNENFAKARMMLLKHFPKGINSAGKQRLFEDLIKQKCSTHTMIKSFSYSEFKQDMLDFVEKLYQFREPFLIKVAKLAEQGQRLDGDILRKSQTDRTADEQSSTTDRAMRRAQLPSEQGVTEDNHPFNPEQNGPSENGPSAVRLSRNMLHSVFQDYVTHLLVLVPFSQVQAEVDREAAELESGIGLDTDELGLRLSETPVNCLLSEAKERERADVEGVSDDEQPMQHGQESPGSDNLIKATGGHGVSVLTPYQVRDQTSAGSENANLCSPASSNQGRKRLHAAASEVTVAQLVMEEDSQTSEFETVHSQLTPSPIKAGCSEEDPLRSLPTNSTPVRKKRRTASSRKSIFSEPEPASSKQPAKLTRVTSSCSTSPDSTPVKHQQTRKMNWMDVSGTHERWSDEDSLFGKSTPAKENSDNKGRRKMWTDEESDWLRQGVAKYGEGQWRKIKSAFPFKDRTSVNIKDRWRTMKKQNLV